MEHHSRVNIPRILFGCVFFLSILIGPYWFALLLALVGYVWFPIYFEMLAAAIFFDLLYFVPAPLMHGIPVSATMGALVLLAIMVFLGERFRLPARKGWS
jgi:hypothetical protein